MQGIEFSQEAQSLLAFQNMQLNRYCEWTHNGCARAESLYIGKVGFMSMFKTVLCIIHNMFTYELLVYIPYSIT